jgi:hypothetical protein
MRKQGTVLAIALALGASSLFVAARAWGQEPPKAQPEAATAPDEGPGPDPIPEFRLAPLPTIPVRRESLGPAWVMADSTVLPKDREGIWVLDFAYKPVRMVEIEIPGKGRRKVHYLYYRVVNRTGEPRRFVPQFTLVTDDGKRHESHEIPLAVQKIQNKEDPTRPLLGAVTVIGEIPLSTKEGIDDAVFGTAIWDDIDYRTDSFQIYVRGLSDGYQDTETPDGQRFTRYKALRLDFTRPGDELNPHSSEIRLGDPPFEWVYYP